uniref:Uncharacterized protein n=1 Tax=Cannabis sativa TaxID=3483 RepID=A0A803PCE8_CANSA
MEKMMARLHAKFEDLDGEDSKDDPSMECVGGNTRENPTDIGTSALPQDKGKAKVTDTSRLRSPLAPKGPVVPKKIALVAVTIMALGPRNPYPSGLAPPPVDGYMVTISGGPHLARITRNS